MNPRPRAVYAACVVYLAGGIVAGTLVDSPDAAFGLAWQYLALPLGALAGMLGYLSEAAPGPPGRRARRRLFTAGVLFGVFMVAAPGYVLLANSVGADGEPVTLAGPVLEKWSRSYKTTGYYVRIRDERTGARVKLEVPAPDYRAIAVGARYGRSFFMGRLGVPYRWTLGSPPPAEP